MKKQHQTTSYVQKKRSGWLDYLYANIKKYLLIICAGIKIKVKSKLNGLMCAASKTGNVFSPLIEHLRLYASVIKTRKAP